MSLTGLHILLTYQCTYECDHCFVWGSPDQAGVFTWENLEEAFQQALALGTIDQIYFEGGESFIFYTLLVKGVRRATELGFSTGVVSNGYWATSHLDARNWLRPLVDAGLDRLEISCDTFHGDDEDLERNHPALRAARLLRLDAELISISPPQTRGNGNGNSRTPTLGDVMYRGRAAAYLTQGLPTRPSEEFADCPFEELADPTRVHLDPYGNLHVCQGMLIGNIFDRPLDQIMREYVPSDHPIAGPLIEGGPWLLAHKFELAVKEGYVDACHFCYSIRQALRPRFPTLLSPDQMYGVG